MDPGPRAPTLDLAEFERLRRLARSLLRDAGGAVDDVVHDAWLRAARVSPVDRAGSGWWRIVLRNVDRSRRRAERLRIGHEHAAADLRPESSTADDPARIAQRLDAARVLIDALEALDEPYRGVVTLRYLEGLSPRAVAVRVGRPVRTVHTQLQRGLAMLRARLEARLGSDGDRRAWITALMPLAVMGKNSMIGWTSAAVLGFGALLGFTVGPMLFGGGDEPDPVAGPRVAAAGPDEAVEREVPGAVDAEPARDAVATEAAVVEVVVPEIRVRGLVVDPQDRPVPGVSLQFAPFTPVDGLVAAVSGDDGRFEFELAEPPAGNVHCIAQDWVGLYEPVLWGQEPEEARELTLVVAPAVEFAGRVVDAETREGLAGVGLHVTAELPPVASFARDLSRCRPAEWRGESAADGSFAMPVAAGLPGVQIHSALAGYEHGHQGVVDPGDVLVELEPSGALLHGQVVDARGEPAAGTAVLCGAAATMSDEQGFFTIDLTHVQEEDSQRHRLLVGARYAEQPAQLYGPEETWRDASTWPQPLVLRLGERSLSIHGTVVERDGSGVPGAQVRALDEQPLGTGEGAGHSWQTVEFHARVSMSIEGGSTVFDEMAIGGAPGHFSVSGLQSRAYRLRVVDPRALRTLVTEPVAAGTSGLEVQLPEEPLWETVGGVVVDRRGAPVHDATVTIARDFAGLDGAEPLQLQLRTDLQGRFRTTHPVSRALDRLAVQPIGTAQGHAIDLVAHPDLQNLRIVAAIAVRARIVATPTSRSASRAAFLDADGQPVPVVITRGDTALGQMQVALQDGATEVLQVLDSATELVLFHPSGERTRHPLELTPVSGTVLEIRP